ncbi:MAG: NAD(P)-binding protein [Halobacteriota archaeon]
MKDDYDVIVVGAGPGGSRAAQAAAQECDVLFIEKRQEIGSPVRCAEGVDLRQLTEHISPDKTWIASKVRGLQLHAPDGTTLELTTEMMGPGPPHCCLGAQDLRPTTRQRSSTSRRPRYGAHPCHPLHHGQRRRKRR